MEADVEAGNVLLAGPAGDVLLVWKRGEKDRARGLPPGSYRLRTVRVEREEKGRHWFVSTTGPAGEPLALEAGKTRRIEVPGEVRFHAMAKRKGREISLGFDVKGPDGRGLSVYRDDRRVPVLYRVLDAKGDEVASGTMNYG